MAFSFFFKKRTEQSHHHHHHHHYHHTVLARASDISHELPYWLSAWQRKRPIMATVAALTSAHARLAFASQ